MYLYEYTEDYELVERPRQLYPHAVLEFIYVGESPRIKPPVLHNVKRFVIGCNIDIKLAVWWHLRALKVMCDVVTRWSFEGHWRLNEISSDCSPKVSAPRERSTHGMPTLTQQRRERRRSSGRHASSSKHGTHSQTSSPSHSRSTSRDGDGEPSSESELKQLADGVGQETESGGLVVWAGQLTSKGVAICNAELVSYIGGVKPARMWVAVFQDIVVRDTW